MLRATLRSLLARKLRLLLSAVAIVLGVSFVSGAFVLTDTLGKTFETLFATVNQNIAVAVRGTQTVADVQGQGAIRRPVPAAALDRVRHVDGVAEARGGVFGEGPQLVGKDGKLVGGGQSPHFGTNWVGPSRLTFVHLVGGTGPRAPDEITVNKGALDSSGYRVGDRVPVISQLPTSTYRIAGVFAYTGDKPSLGGETTIAFELPTARKVLGISAGYTEVDVAAGGGTSQQTLRDRVAKVLPGGTEAVTGKKLSAEQSSGIKQGLGFLNTFLLVFAAVALFVGAFIILNTFTMLVAQRTRELALLRALGASRRQVMSSVVVEAILVGTIASALGLGLGVLVAIGLRALFGAFGAGLPSGPLVFSVRTVVAAFAVGIIVTTVAAFFPARRASSVAPMAALRDAATPDRSLRRPTIIGAVILLLGAVAVTFGLTGSGLPILGVGTLLSFIGVAMLSPIISRPVAGALGSGFKRRLPGRLGRTNTLRNPRRTASTAAALMIGLALVSAVSVLGSSLKASFEKIATSALAADFVLESSGQNGFSPSVVDRLRSQPGVGRVSGLRFAAATLRSDHDLVMALAPSAIGKMVNPERTAGSLALDPHTVLVAKKTAIRMHLKVGSTLPVQFAKGTRQDFTVGGLFTDNGLLQPYIFDESVAANFATSSVNAAVIKLAPGASAAQVRKSLDAAAKPYPNVTVEDQSEFVASQAKSIDQVVTFLTVLLALSVVIAVLGIVNTLALSVIERTRELGLLRAVGMSRRQVKRMIRVEAVIIAVFGGLLGLLVGSAFGIAIQRALVKQGVTELAFPVLRMVVFVVLAALAGVLAAWLPARRASRLNVLSAIAAD